MFFFSVEIYNFVVTKSPWKYISNYWKLPILFGNDVKQTTAISMKWWNKSNKTCPQAFLTDIQTDKNWDEAFFGFSGMYAVKISKDFVYLSNVQKKFKFYWFRLFGIFVLVCLKYKQIFTKV